MTRPPIFRRGADRATVRHDLDISLGQFTNAIDSAGYEARAEVTLR